MTRQQNEYKILLKSLEDDLLMRLSSAGDNILSDSALVENLEFTKKTAADIEIKVKAFSSLYLGNFYRLDWNYQLFNALPKHILSQCCLQPKVEQT